MYEIKKLTVLERIKDNIELRQTLIQEFIESGDKGVLSLLDLAGEQIDEVLMNWEQAFLVITISKSHMGDDVHIDSFPDFQDAQIAYQGMLGTCDTIWLVSTIMMSKDRE
jgi:hypothetical protein